MATIHTIGTSSRNYSTIQSWEDAVPSTPTGGYEGHCYNDSEFTAGVTISGHTTSAANYIKLTTGSGQSFKDHASAATNPQFYDQSKGVGISAAASSFAALIELADDYCTVENLQIKCTGGLVSPVVLLNTFSLNTVIRNCILARTFNDYGPILQVAHCTAINVLGYQTAQDGTATSSAIKLTDGVVVACGFFNTGSTTNAAAIEDDFAGSGVVIDCAFFGWGAAESGSGGSPAVTYTATDLASGFTGSNNQYSKTFASEYQSTTDFRLKTGTSLNAGQRQASYTADLDIIGQARSTSTPYIGQWEFQAGGGATTSLPLRRRMALTSSHFR